MQTDSDNGLITAYLLDGNGGGQQFTWDEIRQWQPNQGTLWVHIDYTQEYARNWLSNESGLEGIIVDNLLAEENRPRTAVFKKGLLLALRGVNLNPGADPEDLVSIRLYATEQLIISSRKRRLLSIGDIRQSIEQGDGPQNSAEFIVFLCDRLVIRLGDIIDDVDEAVDQLEEEALQSQKAEIRQKLSHIRHETITLKRYLAPQRDAMARLHTEKVAWLDDEERMQIREISDRVIRYVEDLDSARERAAVIQEEITSQLSEQMNQRMYILSIVAAIFLPLGFLTGLLGINVGGIPGTDDSAAFWEVLAGLVVISLLQIIIFRHKNWM